LSSKMTISAEPKAVHLEREKSMPSRSVLKRTCGLVLAYSATGAQDIDGGRQRSPVSRRPSPTYSGYPVNLMALGPRRHIIRTMRVLAALAAAIGFDREQTMDKLERLIAEAARGSVLIGPTP